jgi:hypothetical protein
MIMVYMGAGRQARGWQGGGGALGAELAAVGALAFGGLGGG